MPGRIILHTPEPHSGAALYVSALAQALVQAGEPVVLLCPGNFAYIPELRQAGVHLALTGLRSTAPGSRLARLYRNLVFLYESLSGQMRVTRAQDTLHFQFPLYFPAGLLSFLLAKLQARRIVYTAHDPLPHKWLFPGRWRAIEEKCLACAYAWSDRIVVHSPAARDLLIANFRTPAAKIAVIPHGCTEQPWAEMPRLDGGTVRLLTFGSIREDKGIDLAIQAVQRLNAEGANIDLLIAGVVANTREREYWEACKRQIAQAPSGIRVIERFIPDNEVTVLLATCHAVLLPYRGSTSDSGVAALALAAARPVIATNQGSFASLLSASDLGIPIDLPSVAAVAEALRLTLNLGHGELKNRGLRGLAYARSARSWDAVGRQTKNLYEKLNCAPIRPVRAPKHG